MDRYIITSKDGLFFNDGGHCFVDNNEHATTFFSWDEAYQRIDDCNLGETVSVRQVEEGFTFSEKQRFTNCY